MKKKHFYEGMTPLPEDFDTLQQNAEDEVRAVTHAITGSGVLSRLEIKKYDDIYDEDASLLSTITEGSREDNIFYFSDNNKDNHKHTNINESHNQRRTHYAYVCNETGRIV